MSVEYMKGERRGRLQYRLSVILTLIHRLGPTSIISTIVTPSHASKAR